LFPKYFGGRRSPNDTRIRENGDTVAFPISPQKWVRGWQNIFLVWGSTVPTNLSCFTFPKCKGRRGEFRSEF